MIGAYRLQIERCDTGQTIETRPGAATPVSTTAVVPEAGFETVVRNPTQAQLNGLARYCAQITAGTSTAAIEAAIG